MTRRGVLDAIEKVMRSIGFQPAGVTSRDDAVRYAQREGERVCERLLEEGRVATLPECSAFWDEKSSGPVVEIKLPPGTIEAIFKHRES